MIRDEKAWEWVGKSELGYDIWHGKYRDKNETHSEWLHRVSGGDPFLKQLIAERKFLFGGRALANRGTGKAGSMFNCYSSGYAPDDINGLMELNKNIALTYKAQGGQGLSLSHIRPKGTPIGNEFESDGIVPFMEVFNTTTASISQGGARKGALMMSIDIRHKEAETFITIKTNEDKITKANLSLEIDDKFMKDVETFYETGEVITRHEVKEYNKHIVEYDIVPIELYKLMIKTVHEWGEPGCIFTNRFRNYNIMEFDDDYQIETCNPCGEQPLKKDACCNLGSLNLSEFVKNPYTKEACFNYEDFVRAVSIAVEALDTIIDENLDNHALVAQRENSYNFRNIGLGVMGYANALLKLGIKYGSNEAKQFTNKLFKEMFEAALHASCYLAQEKGAFPKCKPEKIIESSIVKKILFNDNDLLERIKKYGLRNCSLLSIAPTGSIATMLGISGGCEPEFALSYKRKTENLKDSYDVYCKSVSEYWEQTDDVVDVGNLSSLPNYFVTSADINWIDRVDTQAIMQEYVDTAISSTVNLPEETTVEEIEQLYLYAWQKGLKGITIYRSGCNRDGILSTGKKTQGEESVDTVDNGATITSHSSTQGLPRGVIVDVSDDLIGLKRKLITGCGSIHLETYVEELTGEPQETFINIGSSGGCERNYQFISRLISLALRAGVPIEAIIDQAKSIRPCNAYVSRTKSKGDTSKGTSCPAAIGHALEELYEKTKNLVSDDEIDFVDMCEEPCAEECNSHDCAIPRTKVNTKNCCPECGGDIHFEGGCNICHSCGWSKCD